MPSLRELQLRFVDTLFDERRPVPEQITGTGGFAVHRNNLRSAFRTALALDFPVIARLVGTEYFSALAWDYQREWPSRSGDLQHIGTRFAEFLARRFTATRYACFADVAALEWLLQLVQHDAAREPLAVAALAAVEPSRYGEQRLTVQARLLRSNFPILRIWTANQGDAAASIDLDSGGECVLVRRHGDLAVCEVITRGEYEFLAALVNDATLAQALDAALALEEDFDLAACLQRAVERCVLGRISGAPQAASDSGCGIPIA